jgi:hypothetical protein
VVRAVILDVSVHSTGGTGVVLGAVFCEMLGALTVLTEQCDAGNIYRVELAVARSMSEFTAELTTHRGSIVQKSGS